MSSQVRVRLPAQLRILAGTGPEVLVEVTGPVTQRSVLAGLEQRYPVLLGTIRDRTTSVAGRSSGFCRGRPICRTRPRTLLPDPVASGGDVFVVVGAMAGG